MDERARAAVESRLSALCEARDWDAAATLAVREYGPELLGFLVGLHGNRDEAAEIFSMVCEDIWRGLEGFERRASFRTWAYTLTRHALYRHQRRERRHRHGHEPLVSTLSEAVQAVRTTTLSYLRSTKKTRLQELRASLPEEDQALLILRVDRDLAWTDIARVLGEVTDDESVTRESARLRKRFQLVKDRLREQALAEGLIKGDE